jgi:L-serine dehydratase
VEREAPDFWDHMDRVWSTMKRAIARGLSDEGILPGGLNVKKKAKSLWLNQHIDESPATRENRMVCSFAFAVSEQNASGEQIVTAPTCGAAGVVPAVLYYQQQKNGYSDREVIKALITAGIIGNLIKTNASISGAECGCQAEIGSACAMAAAALGELFSLDIDKIEYAAEIAIEHHLGLTCDPICGLVQIPCIERNAVAAMRAMNACNLSYFLTGSRNISYDMVCRAMHETGINLNHRFRETSEGGLAKIYARNKKG